MKILFRSIVISTTVDMITFADRIRKDNLAFFVNVLHEAFFLSAFRTGQFVALLIFLEMKSVFTHSYPIICWLHFALFALSPEEPHILCCSALLSESAKVQSAFVFEGSFFS